MKSIIMIVLSIISLYADGERVYKSQCASCHVGFIPMGALKENFVEYNNTKLNLKGPTLNQLSFRLKQNIGNPKGDEEFHLMEVSEFIKDYVYNPDKQKSVCMDEVLEAFETMPSMRGKISEDDLDEVATYIYHYDQKSLAKNAPKYTVYKRAVQRAKDENKIIMIKATSQHCHFCKKMDREVFVDKEVVGHLEKDFIAVEVDIYKERLPEGLETQVTPTFFFLSSDEKVLKRVPGALDKGDFMMIMGTVKELDKGVKR